MESCPTQAVLPLVGLAAEQVIRDRYNMCGGPSRARGPIKPREGKGPVGASARYHGVEVAAPTRS
ncbi:MAG: hypothetical protein ACQESR_05950 [Planctomycetota bacterium]